MNANANAKAKSISKIEGQSIPADGLNGQTEVTNENGNDQSIHSIENI